MTPSARPARIGILTVSDRASSGGYADASGPAMHAVLAEILASPWEAVARTVPDGVESVRDALIAYSDEAGRGFRFEAGRRSEAKPATIPI